MKEAPGRHSRCVVDSVPADRVVPPIYPSTYCFALYQALAKQRSRLRPSVAAFVVLMWPRHRGLSGNHLDRDNADGPARCGCRAETFTSSQSNPKDERLKNDDGQQGRCAPMASHAGAKTARPVRGRASSPCKDHGGIGMVGSLACGTCRPSGDPKLIGGTTSRCPQLGSGEGSVLRAGRSAPTGRPFILASWRRRRVPPVRPAAAAEL
jgi:hypothetical protein